jgi:hypothetical protein
MLLYPSSRFGRPFTITLVIVAGCPATSSHSQLPRSLTLQLLNLPEGCVEPTTQYSTSCLLTLARKR